MTAFQHCDPLQLLETVGDDRGIFLELLDIFMRDSVEKFEGMRVAMAASDLPQLEFLSHSLKGTVGPLGALALVDELFQIEDACGNGSYRADPAQLARLGSVLEQIRLEMQAFAARLPA